MSADEPLATRIAGMITRAKDKAESLEYQLEDAHVKLAQLEMAEGFAKVLTYIDGGMPFEMEFRIVGKPEDNMTLVCSGGVNMMAQVRTLVMALLDVEIKGLAEL